MAVENVLPGPLADHEQARLAAPLQATLIDLIDLSLVAKQAHWNVVGRQFHDVHLHLDELVETTRRYTDEVAERAAALGISPDGRSSVLASTTVLPEFPAGWVSDRDVVRLVAEAVDTVVRRLRHRIDEAEKVDLVTQDLFIDVARALEKSRWMWQAQTLGADEA